MTSAASDGFQPHRARLFLSGFLKYAGRSFVTLGAFTLALVICATVPNDSIQFHSRPMFQIRKLQLYWWLPIGIAIALAMLLIGWMLVKRSRSLKLGLRRKSIANASGIDVVQASKMLAEHVPQINKRLSAASLGVLAKAVIQPSLITSRVTEHITLSDSRLLRKVHRQLNLEAEHRRPFRRIPQKPVLYVPVLRHRKQRLMDELDIEVDGSPTTALPHNSNIAVTVTVAKQMFEQAFPDDFAQKDRIFSLISGVISYPAPASATKPYAQLLREIVLAQIRHHPDKARLTELKGFLEYFADYYFVYIEVDASNPPQSISTLYSERRQSDVKGFSGFVRRTLGIPVYRYRIPVTEATNCSTYHLRTKAPEHTYLSHAYCRVSTNPWDDLRFSREFSQSEALFAPTYGSDIVHFYTRDLRRLNGKDQDKKLYVDLDFQVTPPALSFPILCLLIYLVILTTAIALVQELVFTSAVPNLGKNVTTLVFAVPAIMSGWVLARLDRQGMRTASPVALLELASTLLLTALCVTMTAVEGASPPPPPLSHPKLWIFTISAPAHQLAWAVIWVLVTGQFFTSGIAAAARARRFHSALKRADHEFLDNRAERSISGAI